MVLEERTEDRGQSTEDKGQVGEIYFKISMCSGGQGIE
jgi:hypothetical protein